MSWTLLLTYTTSLNPPTSFPAIWAQSVASRACARMVASGAGLRCQDLGRVETTLLA